MQKSKQKTLLTTLADYKCHFLLAQKVTNGSTCYTHPRATVHQPSLVRQKTRFYFLTNALCSVCLLAFSFFKFYFS